MTMLLYTQPPPAIKFFPYVKDVYNSRGAVVVLEKEEKDLPTLDFYRFDFFLEFKNNTIKEAHFIIEQLINVHEYAIGSRVPWYEEREDVSKFLEADEEEKGLESVADHDAALNYWKTIIDHSFTEMQSEEDLKNNFSMLMDGVFVVRHYFETEWVVFRGIHPIKMNFKGVYKGGKTNEQI